MEDPGARLFRNYLTTILVSSVPMSPLSLFVIVIGRPRAGSSTRADECTLPTTDQCPCAGANGCADTDAFCGLLFSGFRIVITPVSVLATGDGNCERERDHQQ